MKLPQLLLALAPACISAVPLYGAISINSSNFSYSQNFNSLPTGASGSTLSWTNNSTIAGWYMDYDGGTRNEYSFQVTPNGSGGVTSGGVSTQTSARFANFGHANASDRSLGMWRPNSLFGAIGAVFQNTSGTGLTGFSVGFTGEQWRRHSTGQTALYFEYQIVASIAELDIDSAPGGWTRVAALQFNSLQSGGGLDLDGKHSSNRTTISPVAITASIPHDMYLVVRWYQDRTDSSGNASTVYHMLAIDNVSLTVVPEPSTYALFGGFAALGLALMRRRSVSRQS
jgi:hypothetical protein